MPEAAHRRRRSDARNHWLIAAVVVALCALAAASTALVATRVSPSPAAATPTASPGRLSVVASQPAPDATNVASDAGLSVQFTVPLALDSPVPTLSPAVPGLLGADVARRPGLRRHRSAPARRHRVGVGSRRGRRHRRKRRAAPRRPPHHALHRGAHDDAAAPAAARHARTTSR